MSQNAILVVGGCGFVGFHIVSALRNDQRWQSIHVMSRNPSINQQDGVTYHAGDITSPVQIKKILSDVRPIAIIHSASSVASGNDITLKGFLHVNLAGTKNLLDQAAANPDVKIFIYTSSTSVMAGSTFKMITEDAPMITEASRGVSPYSKSKASADRLVLEANGKGDVRTVSLRICSVYGERNNQVIPNALRLLQQGRHKTQVGDNQSLFDITSVENAATAHLLALKALLQPPKEATMKVDGEAFFITEDDPIPFWTFVRKIWTAGGDNTPLSEVRVVPAWLTLSLASIVEWVYFIFTLGRKQPKTFRREVMEYTCQERTFCIDKARTRLNYHPNSEKRDEHIRKGVEWALQGKAKHSIKVE